MPETTAPHGADVAAGRGADVAAGHGDDVVARHGADVVARRGADVVARHGADVVARHGADFVARHGADFVARHGVLTRGYGHRPDPDDPGAVLAMPIVLHIPKQDPPARSALLEAAAMATVALCLDPRVGTGPDGEPGPWREPYLAWTDARIRKVSRRARGAQWRAAQEVDGITVEHRGAQARALVPGPVGLLDPRISRLQIGGTDLPHDTPDDPPAGVPVLWIDAALDMTVGKAAAQVGHAAMLFAGSLDAEHAGAWAESGFECAVRDADSVRWRHLTKRVADGTAVAVRDAGFTEVAPGSVTVIAVPG